MEYFYGGGGTSNPGFVYRFLVKEITTEMWQWLEKYPLHGPFDRWYIQRNGDPYSKNEDKKEIPMVQIENRKAAYMFMLAYSEYIIANKSLYEVKP